MAQYDEDYFKKQFEGLPPRAQAAIALRAAMRVLPVFASREEEVDTPFGYWKDGERDRHILSIFRVFQASAFVNSLTKADNAARATARAAKATARAADAARTTVATAATPRAADAAARAAAAAARAADAAARAAAAAARAADAAAADVATRTAARATATATAADAAARAANATVCATKAIARAIEYDLQTLRTQKAQKPSIIGGVLPEPTLIVMTVLESPLWPKGMPYQLIPLWQIFQTDAMSLDAGFEIWLDWYHDRLEGRPFNWEIERVWASLSKERLAQGPLEINAYLRSIRYGVASKQLKRVRAIFIGHGEVGKTSLIKAIHGEEVIVGEQTTKGVAIDDAKLSIDEKAGVFTRVTEFKEDDLTVHFWDFGGQVMAHATHQFFLRAKCLYVIVLAGRAERNSNEEAEYWLEHVRAFGDSAPVLLVGNKCDSETSVNLDVKTLRDKYQNIVGFYSISCTQAKGRFRPQFEIFQDAFKTKLLELGQNVERFTPAQFQVLKTVQEEAAKRDFLSASGFDEICEKNSIEKFGPLNRDALLRFFDTLGIVIHFENLPYLTNYVLNPRWLTYGVYTIMYSDEAQAAKGRIGEAQLVSILKNAIPAQNDGRLLRYPADRCRLIAEAMTAFRVAYQLENGELVIPALLPPEQPEHDFKSTGALFFQFNFKGFLPRHVLPTFIVDRYLDIARDRAGRETVWQNGVLLRPKRRYDAEALVRADYHTRTLEILVKGSDANTYLGLIRDSIFQTLDSMSELLFEEKVQLRPEMRSGNSDLRTLGEKPIMMDYNSIIGAQKHDIAQVVGSDGFPYDVKKILSVLPARSPMRPADVFLSYSSKDGEIITKLADDLEAAGITVWYDEGLIGGQPYRDVLAQRIDTLKAVVVLWTENSIGSKWVRAEADRAGDKLICLRDPKLPPKDIPMPFAGNDHILQIGEMPGLYEALRDKSVGRR